MKCSFGTPILVLDQFAEMRLRGVEMLRSLDASEWLLPTAVPGWSVHDIAIHLAGGMLANVARRRDGHDGNFAQFTPAGVTDGDPDWVVQTLNAWNEAWVAAGRRLSPRLTIELLDQALIQLVEFFRTVNLMEIGDAVGWAGPDPAPVWLDVAREYTEVWSHLAQIREATGRPLVDDPELFAPVIVTFAYGIPNALRGIDRPQSAVLRVVVRGEAGGEWSAVRGDAGWELVAGSAADPDAVVRIQDEVMWRLATRALDPGQALGFVEIEGDFELSEGFLNLVAILA